jgi:hypothetical protein
MERKATCGERNYLPSYAVEDILGVTHDDLSLFVEHGIVRPLREPMRNNIILWEPEDILRVFLGLRLVEEFEIKYKGEYHSYLYDQVRGDLFKEMRARRKEILESKEWTLISKKAAKNGLNLLDLKKIKLNGSLAPKDRN